MPLIIAQTASGISTEAGISSEPAWSGQPISLTWSPGGDLVEHEILYQPEGASASFSGNVFTPTADVAGTYRIRSKVTRAGVSEELIRIVRVGFDAAGEPLNHGAVALAYNEDTDEGDEEHGGTRTFERSFAALSSAIDTAQALGSRVDALEAGDTAQDAAITAHTAALASLDTRTDALEASDTSQDASIAAHASALEDLEARVAELEANAPEPWSPVEIPNILWWSKGISDPTLRTMTGSRVDLMQNGVPNGLVLTRSAGNPTIDTGNSQNGFNPLVLDSTAELLSAAGGPVGNEEHCVIVLARWTSTTAEGVFRCGAKDNCNAVGVTTSSRFGAGRPLNDGVPRIDTSPGPVPDGTIRAISAHRKPSMTNGANPYNFIRIDGRAPIAASGASWAYAAAHPSLDGSFGHGRSSAGASANTSLVYDAIIVKGGDISAGDFARLLDYWQDRFGWADEPPMIHWSGDSITNGDDLSSPTTERYTATTLTAVNAQCALEGRPTVEAIQNSLGGKRVGGAWNASNVPMTFQASGDYQNAIIATGAEGIHYSAPFSRSGRRRWDLYSLMGLTNDIVSDDISVDEAKSRVRQCVTSYRAARGFVLLWTTITGASGFWTPSKEAKRQELIAWMTGAFLSETNGPHRVVNCELAGLVHPTDFVAGIPGNLHPNAAGHNKITAVGWPILMQMIRDIDSGALAL